MSLLIPRTPRIGSEVSRHNLSSGTPPLPEFPRVLYVHPLQLGSRYLQIRQVETRFWSVTDLNISQGPFFSQRTGIPGFSPGECNSESAWPSRLGGGSRALGVGTEACNSLGAIAGAGSCSGLASRLIQIQAFPGPPVRCRHKLDRSTWPGGSAEGIRALGVGRNSLGAIAGAGICGGSASPESASQGRAAADLADH